MINNRTIKTVLISMIIFLILLSCNLFSEKSEEVNENGFLSLTIENSVNRTITPTFSISSYSIIFSNGPVSKDPISVINTTETVPLAIGNWDISIDALDSNLNIIATGSVSNITISADTITSETITLNPLSTGTGSVDVTFSWSESEGIDVKEITLDGVTIDASNLTESTANGTVSLRYQQDLNPGDYKLKLLLKTGDVLKLTSIEIIKIYGNLISSETISFSSDNFTSAPEMPSPFTATQDGARLLFSWTDNSNIETGFIIERSLNDTNNFIVVSDSIPAGSTSYEDTTMVVGNTYYYRIKATNSFGESTYEYLPGDGSINVNIPVVSTISPTDNLVIKDTTPTLDWSTSTYITEHYDLQIATENSFTSLLINETNLNLSTYTVTTPLTNGETYYWRVRATNSDGNFGIWTTTSSFNINVETGITIIEIMNNPIDITFSGNVESIIYGSDMTVTATEIIGATYQWFLDGVLLTDEATNTITIGSELGYGTYIITLLVENQGIYSSEETSFTVRGPIVGDYYQGGIVFYLYENGSGLISAEIDQSNSSMWNNGESSIITNATSTAIGTGKSNTELIVAVHGVGDYAAKICYDLIIDGFNDWYLPSKDELNEIYMNKDLIGGFSTYHYWSSSESMENYAWSQNFSNGSQDEFFFSKNSVICVRAIRSFNLGE